MAAALILLIGIPTLMIANHALKVRFQLSQKWLLREMGRKSFSMVDESGCNIDVYYDDEDGLIKSGSKEKLPPSNSNPELIRPLLATRDSVQLDSNDQTPLSPSTSSSHSGLEPSDLLERRLLEPSAPRLKADVVRELEQPPQLLSKYGYYSWQINYGILLVCAKLQFITIHYDDEF